MSGDTLSPVLLKTLLLESYYHFAKYFFKKRYGHKIQDAPHVKVLCDFVQKMVMGEFCKGIINIPTGHSKTLLTGELLVPWLMARNPASKNIIVCYSDTIPLKTSEASKKIIELAEYQKLFAVKINKNEKGKGFWRTLQGGGLLATGAGGSVTGHDAGSVPSDPYANYEFDGMMIWDDPMKPMNAIYENYREKILNLYAETLRTRLRNPKAPMLIVMQRLHDDDISGKLLRGATADKWHHLILPARIDADYEYPADYIHGIHYPHGLPSGALWEFKNSLDRLDEDLKFSPYVTWAEKMQKPLVAGGGLFKDAWWSNWDNEQPQSFNYRFIVCDTAQKTKEHNDYSVFQCWGLLDKVDHAEIYLIDQLKGKWEAPELKNEFTSFYMKHRGTGTQTTNPLRYARIEDASSGTYLIQELERVEGINIKPITRCKDKYTRTLDYSPEIAKGRVKLPLYADFVSDLKREAREFTANDTHKHDDQIDCVLDAIQEMTEKYQISSGVMF